MALIDCKFFSETLGMCSSLRVILPETTRRRIGGEVVSRAGGADFQGHPTLWLLHGMSDDETIWTRSTSVERYVAPLGLAVVMPNVHRSFYSNMRHGYRYWDFVSQELLEKARSFFPLSPRREDNFVAGLSMGGHGAFKLALKKPELFAAAASLSGVADVTEFRQARAHDYELVFGGSGPERGSEHDLFHLASALGAAEGPRPRLYQCCGTEDSLIHQNRALRDWLEPLGYDYQYVEGPGAHDWAYWDAMIAKVVNWLPLGGSGLDRAGSGS
jgi:putative tributyrin esterase